MRQGCSGRSGRPRASRASSRRRSTCGRRPTVRRRCARQFERSLWILASIAALVLLIAGSNVANLFLARTAAREREMALRLSIGAGRGRLIQQMLVESALVAAAACALGLLFAAVAGPAVVGMLASADDPVQLDLRLDWRLLAFAGGLTLLTTALFGIAPALRASSVAPMTALKTGGGRSGSARRRDASVRGRPGRVRSGRAVRRQPAGAVVRQAVEREPGLRHVGRAAAVSGSRPARGRESAARGAASRCSIGCAAFPASRRSAPPSPTCSAARGPTIVRVPGTQNETIEATMAPVTPGFFETMKIPAAGRPRVRSNATWTPRLHGHRRQRGIRRAVLRPRAGGRPDARGALRR